MPRKKPVRKVQARKSRRVAWQYRLTPKLLVEKHQGIITEICKKYAPSFKKHSLSLSDLVGMVNLQVLKVIKKYDPKRGIKAATFIGKVVEYRLNVELNYYKTQKRSSAREVRFEKQTLDLLVDRRPRESRGPAHEASILEQRRRIQDVVSQLNVRDRELIDLHINQGLSLMKIARKKGIALHVVRDNWIRLLHSLRKKVNELE